MKAIFIEPDIQQVSVRDIQGCPRDLRELLGAAPRRVARLPNGDLLLASAEPRRGRQFAMGNSLPVVGPAVLIGCPGRFREHRPSKSDVISIKRLVHWL
jgi:hypothetical protein